MCKIFSLILTIKSQVIFKNFNFGMLKLIRIPILPNCQWPNVFFVNLIIWELKFCKIAQLFVVSVSMVRNFFEGMRKNSLHIFRHKHQNQCCLGFFQWNMNYLSITLPLKFSKSLYQMWIWLQELQKCPEPRMNYIWNTKKHGITSQLLCHYMCNDANGLIEYISKSWSPENQWWSWC